MTINKKNISRRHFIGSTVTAAAGLLITSGKNTGAPAFMKNFGKPDSLIRGVQIGVITYSYRSLPDQSTEATLKYILDCGISAIELMGDPAESFAGKPESTVDRRAFFGLMRKVRNNETLTENEQKQMSDLRAEMDAYGKKVADWRSKVSMDKYVKLKKMYTDAGVRIYAWKPDAFGVNNTDAEIDYGFKVARMLGASHITLEHPGNDAHTKKLAEMASQHKVYVAYHGHEQQTPTLWDTALAQSEYNSLNLDLGHYVAAGNPDPLPLIQSIHGRIMSMHLKDRQDPEHGKANLPWGAGNTPIAEALRLMRDRGFKFPGSIELEYEIPEGSDAIKEVSRCLDFCRKALEA
ncbi:MAG TPA: TIM barrel protein [Cyclobacteriaceae bacterium]|nr:TIM barrel protein [Cyclobacteriaceae bacterium]